MHFKIETISALPTDISYRKLRLRADGNHPPVAPLRLRAYRDTARSLGYPLAVVCLRGVRLNGTHCSSLLKKRRTKGASSPTTPPPISFSSVVSSFHPTLRASPSGTFLQTLPDLVTPLKGHSVSAQAVQRRGQRPPKGSGTNVTAKATWRPSTHVNMRRIHPG